MGQAHVSQPTGKPVRLHREGEQGGQGLLGGRGLVEKPGREGHVCRGSSGGLQSVLAPVLTPGTFPWNLLETVSVPS